MARRSGHAIPPPGTGPTSCSRYSKEVTTPKLAPPPRTAQNRSDTPWGWRPAGGRRRSRCRRIRDCRTRGRACLRATRCRRRGSDRRSRLTRQCQWAWLRRKPGSRGQVPPRSGPRQRGLSASPGRCGKPFIRARSIISPLSHTALPETLCPPPRTEITHGPVFRAINKAGRVSGDVACHPKCSGMLSPPRRLAPALTSSHRTICGEPAPVCATWLAESWTRSSFFSPRVPQLAIFQGTCSC